MIQKDFGTKERGLLRIGCHLSVAKGFLAAVEQAPQLGASAFQYFTQNPRGLKGGKPINPVDAQKGRERMRELDLVAIGHASYLINLASPEDGLFEASIAALTQDLVIAEARGTYGVVVHCGKPKTEGPEFGVARMQSAIAAVLDRAPAGGPYLLLENTAGQGSEIGSTIEELLAITEPFDPERVGFCLDTQHAFAAGILTADNPGACAGFSTPAFIDRLHAIHLNDSKIPWGGRRDRHELIGQGYLGLQAIGAILNDSRLQHIPFYLETPINKEIEYAEEIRICRGLLSAGSEAIGQ